MDVVRSLYYSIPLIPITNIFFTGLAYFQHRGSAAWKFLVVSGCIWVLLFIILPILPWNYLFWRLKGEKQKVSRVLTLEELIHVPYYEFFFESSKESADYEPDITLCQNIPAVAEMKQRIDHMFDLPPRPYPPIFTKLPGQKQ